MKQLRAIGKTLLVLCYVGAAVMVPFSVAQLFGAVFVFSASDSMAASGIHRNTVYFVSPIDASDIEIGDFIMARSPFGDPITHQVVSPPGDADADCPEIEMKGTSNQAQDAFPYRLCDGASKVRWIGPVVGDPVALVMVMVPLRAAIAGVVTFDALRERRKREYALASASHDDRETAHTVASTDPRRTT